MSEMTSGTGKKYAGIDRAGKAVFHQEGGTIQEFLGFPESLNNRFNVSLLFTPASEAVFKQKVADPVGAIGNDLGIEFILAGRDFRIHATLLEGLYEGSNPDEREEKFRQVLASQTVSTIHQLVGKTVEYKYLLIDKGNILLTAIEIPEWVLAAREELASVYTEQGLRPLLMADILHISAARITRLPAEDRTLKFRKYNQRIALLRHQIAAKPLVLEVGVVSTVPPLELLCG